MNIVIGAGVSGLSYAAFSKEDYRILEATDSIGGYCKTVKRNGYTWDYSGHFFHFRNEDIKKFVFDRMENQCLYEVDKNTKIKFRDKYIDFPFQKNIHQLDKSDYIDCLIGLVEREEGLKQDSFKDFVLAGYGRGISERFLIPYNEKLYACDLNSLDAGAMGRFFPNADFKEIILNARKGNNESYNSKFIYPEGGAIEFVKAIACDVDQTKIDFNETVVKIFLDKKIVLTDSGKEYQFEKVISTIPLPCLYELCGVDYDKKIYSANSVAVFNIGFDRPANNPHHWVYFPDKESSYYRVGYYNNIMSQERMSLYVEVGLQSGVSFNKETLFKRVVKDLIRDGVIVDQQIVDWDFVLMDPAYVHINSLSESDKIIKKNYLAEKGVYSIGRYGSWTYCSIEDNIIEAMLLAENNESKKN